jgi:16S rRNA (guanine527-N7)-methyltransferase
VIDAIAAAAKRNVSRETFEKLEAYVALIRAENERQNLVSRSTLDHIWERHIVDSAQLVPFEQGDDSYWVDLVSGAGLP